MFTITIYFYDYIAQKAEHVILDKTYICPKNGFVDAFEWIEKNLKIPTDGHYEPDLIWGRYIWYRLDDDNHGYDNVYIEAARVES